MSKTNYRCIECAEYHEGDCDPKDKLAFAMDCVFEGLDELLDLPPEPGSRRWMVAHGEYPPNVRPSGNISA